MNVVLITDSPRIINQLQALLKPFPDHSLACMDSPAFLVQPHTPQPDLAILDSASMSHEELHRAIKRIHDQVPVLVILHEPDYRYAEPCLLAGAQDALPACRLTGEILLHAMTMASLRHKREERLRDAIKHAQKMQSIGRMTSGIAHDYNNLLTIIMNQAVLARESLPDHDPARVDICDQIEVIKQASALTRRLLLMTRRKAIETSAVNLNDLLDGMKKIFHHITGEQIHLSINLSGQPPWVMADSSQLEQALINLVLNACDAMERKGALCIATDLRDLRDDLEHLYLGRPDEPSRVYAMISVADTGCGLDPVMAEHLFELSRELFSHSESIAGVAPKLAHQLFEPFLTTKKHERGTGLGLYQVYSAIKHHDGLISIHSEPQRGCEFRLFLPLAENPQPQPDAAPSARCHKAESREQLLLVEDDPSVSASTRRILEQLGYEVTVAETAAHAQALGPDLLRRVSVLLCDVILPDLDGYQLAENLRQVQPDLRVIFISGYPDEKLENMGFCPENHIFLPKPFSLEQVAELLRSSIHSACR